MKYRFVALLILLFIACSTLPRHESPIIRIKGSDTMFLLTRHWAEQYMREHPNISVYVQAGGTGTGTIALAKGEADICTASRPLRPDEVHMLAEKFGTVGIAVLVAKDAISIYLHPKNPLKDLSLEQLKSIYTGKFTNWKQVGGFDQPILLLNRMPNSGTYVYFQEHVLGGENYRPDAKTLATTAAIVRTVEKNVNAIGFGGIGYESPDMHCSVSGIEPTVENVMNDRYPITRYLYFYTINTPRGNVKKFIDWVLGAEGQSIVRQEGYFSIWNAK